MKEELPEKAKTLKLKAWEKYSLCTCGKSKNLPYCDNSHRMLNEEKGTSYKSLKIISTSDTEIKVYCSNWDYESSRK
ncbi:MAG: CDGSH iron-sulfur domain-containing protein [Nanoarchaeota archaeon]